jgi:hypothetical protein
MEGHAANPNALEILAQIGVLHVTRYQDITEGQQWFERTMLLGAPVADRLSENEHEGLVLAYRWAAICHNHQGNEQDLRRVVSEGIKLLPYDQVMRRFAIQLGLPVEDMKSG